MKEERGLTDSESRDVNIWARQIDWPDDADTRHVLLVSSSPQPEVGAQGQALKMGAYTATWSRKTRSTRVSKFS